MKKKQKSQEIVLKLNQKISFILYLGQELSTNGKYVNGTNQGMSVYVVRFKCVVK